MVKNRKLAKSISDASWALFRQWLEYFGRIYSGVMVPVNPNYTSQNCSNCGQLVKKSLSVRTHVCSCGIVLDRDENAAINILQMGLKQVNYPTTVGHTESNACPENPRYLDLDTSHRCGSSLKQESSHF